MQGGVQTMLPVNQTMAATKRVASTATTAIVFQFIVFLLILSVTRPELA
jgi:hypothetical protein